MTLWTHKRPIKHLLSRCRSIKLLSKSSLGASILWSQSLHFFSGDLMLLLLILHGLVFVCTFWPGTNIFCGEAWVTLIHPRVQPYILYRYKLGCLTRSKHPSCHQLLIHFSPTVISFKISFYCSISLPAK